MGVQRVRLMHLAILKIRVMLHLVLKGGFDGGFVVFGFAASRDGLTVT